MVMAIICKVTSSLRVPSASIPQILKPIQHDIYLHQRSPRRLGAARASGSAWPSEDMSQF